MEIKIAKTAGFCFGVKRAIDMAFDVAQKHQTGVCTLGPIIHNPQVVEELRASGVEPVEGPEQIAGRKDLSTVIVRTHGVPEDVIGGLNASGYKVVDATCPFVKKAQHYAKLLKEQKYTTIILGDREHPEVKGIMSYAGEGVIVVRDADDYKPQKGRLGRIGIVVQTTQHVENLKRLLNVVVEHAKEIKVYNTICNSTARRLRETEDLARSVDVMVIVGGKNSANTTQLAKLCRSLSVPTYHIETSDEVQDEWFRGARAVGLTAGASTPDWIIQKVYQRIKHIGGLAKDGNE